MSAAEFFLDTNILAYTFDTNDKYKRAVATELVTRAFDGSGCISLQVVQEFLNLALRKFKPVMTKQQAEKYLETVLNPLCVYYPDIATYHRALAIQERWRYSWYDSLIITAAIDSGCDTLYSEDLQHGQTIETLTITNPFTPN